MNNRFLKCYEEMQVKLMWNVDTAHAKWVNHLRNTSSASLLETFSFPLLSLSSESITDSTILLTFVLLFLHKKVRQQNKTTWSYISHFTTHYYYVLQLSKLQSKCFSSEFLWIKKHSMPYLLDLVCRAGVSSPKATGLFLKWVTKCLGNWEV